VAKRPALARISFQLRGMMISMTDNLTIATDRRLQNLFGFDDLFVWFGD
jgi:hypothetical protein